MSFTAYGKREIAAFSICGIIGAAALAVTGYATGIWWIYLSCILPAAFVGFSLFFFRDPHRNIPQEPGAVVSPADGTITELSEVNESSYLNTSARKLGIFLSLFSVHLNRVPYTGRIEYTKYTPGKFLNAGNLESSKVNESNAVGIATGKCKMLLRQVSGVIARRIVCELKEGDSVQTGQKFGMIKFGSRTELYVPLDSDFEVRVRLGQKVKAGETIIGVFKQEGKH